MIGLGREYKRVNAPVGELGMTTLAAATLALEAADPARLAQTDAALDALGARRADLAARMRAALESAAFSGQRVDPAQVAAMQAEAQELLRDAFALIPSKG